MLDEYFCLLYLCIPWFMIALLITIQGKNVSLENGWKCFFFYFPFCIIFFMAEGRLLRTLSSSEFLFLTDSRDSPVKTLFI